MANVLVIDDDLILSSIMEETIIKQNHRAAKAHSLSAGLTLARSQAFDVIFLDVKLPDGNGLDHMPEFKKTPGKPDIIIITGSTDLDGAAMAIDYGAWDYMCKPFNISDVKLQLMRNLLYRSETASQPPCRALKRDKIIGSSPALNASLDKVAQASTSMVNVLINGATGTGKELFAKAVHDNSKQQQNPFVTLDCSVLPEKLIESTLFGYKKGAFTGAEKNTNGLVKHADNGTLFLDEVGELPLELQKTFLRVIQEKRFRPIGSSREIKSNFRLVAATNRNLNELAARGKFREDLLFRLQAFQIELSPLKKRLDDIEELTLYHLSEICKRNQMETKGLSPDFCDALSQYDWPGNVRELVNTLESAVAAATFTPILFPIHLPNKIRMKIVQKHIKGNPLTPLSPDVKKWDIHNFPTLKTARSKAIEELEDKYLNELYIVSRGTISDACRLSGLKRTRLWELFKKYNIKRPEKK